MASRSETGAGAPPQLPEGMTLKDLRFVHPQLYPMSMVVKGWEVLLQHGIGGNEARVSYSLARPVPNILNLDELKRSIGVVDEDDNNLPGYYIGTADSEDARKSLGRKIGFEDITDGDGNSVLTQGVREDESYLMFNFTGFPTAKTMDVLMSLEEQFLADAPQFASPDEIGEQSVTLVPRNGKPITLTNAEPKPKTRRLRALANSFANVTPERHQDKVEDFRRLAEQTRANGKYKVRDILDGQDWIESYRFGGAISAVIVLAPLGLQNFISSAERGDPIGAIVGAATLALAVRLAKAPIRAMDNSAALLEVWSEDLKNS